MADVIVMNQETQRVRAEGVELVEGEDTVTVKLSRPVPVGKVAVVRVEATAVITDKKVEPVVNPEPVE